MKTSRGIDMLHGPMPGRMIAFALPLIASGVLQQSFNAVDVAVIGRLADSRAMAAVGSNGPVVSIMINLFLGIAVGANVVISTYLGQRNDDGVRRAVATVGVVALASGAILAVAGSTLARPILNLMGAPPEVIELAARYLRIFFLGMPMIMVFNFGAAILRSCGDTRSPLYALLAATAVNAAADWVAVACLGYGVEGVAWATVGANAVNAAIIVAVVMRLPGPCAFRPRSMAVSRPELRKMLAIGVPAGLQGMVFSLSNIFIQSSVNRFGADAIAGSAAALAWESYCYYIISSFGAAAIAFTGQNYGAGDRARCRRVLSVAMGCAVAFSAVANILIAVFDRQAVALFSADTEVFRYAAVRIHVSLMWQWVACSYEIAGAWMRGLGRSVTPMAIAIAGTCVLRLVWVTTVASATMDFALLLAVYPISWVVTGVMMLAAARRTARQALG